MDFFKIGDTEYELKYNMKRIEMIEGATDKPILGLLQECNMMLKLQDLITYFSYALKEHGADAFVSLKEAREICEKQIETEGYANVTAHVLEALQRDCPFFFQVG